MCQAEIRTAESRLGSSERKLLRGKTACVPPSHLHLISLDSLIGPRIASRSRIASRKLVSMCDHRCMITIELRKAYGCQPRPEEWSRPAKPPNHGCCQDPLQAGTHAPLPFRTPHLVIRIISQKLMYGASLTPKVANGHQCDTIQIDASSRLL
jgi:hypothetical protein